MTSDKQSSLESARNLKPVEGHPDAAHYIGKSETERNATATTSNISGRDAGDKLVTSIGISRDETDGRGIHDWKSRYPAEALSKIKFEAFIVGTISVSSLIIIFLLWSGLVAGWAECEACSRPAFNRYGYFFLGGVLGGTLFGVKFLYHVVAKGFWNEDRFLWRIFSPLLSGSLAFIVGALTDAGLLGLTTSASRAPAFLSLGFITGYFGDKALAKMTEIADVIFGTRDFPKKNKTVPKSDEPK